MQAIVGNVIRHSKLAPGCRFLISDPVPNAPLIYTGFGVSRKNPNQKIFAEIHAGLLRNLRPSNLDKESARIQTLVSFHFKNKHEAAASVNAITTLLRELTFQGGKK